jgi:hypothetical protein
MERPDAGIAGAQMINFPAAIAAVFPSWTPLNNAILLTKPGKLPATAAPARLRSLYADAGGAGGGGYARALMEHVLADAWHRGARTASLQSTRMGQPRYAGSAFGPWAATKNGLVATQ